LNKKAAKDILHTLEERGFESFRIQESSKKEVQSSRARELERETHTTNLIVVRLNAENHIETKIHTAKESVFAARRTGTPCLRHMPKFGQ
jgi:hypothetical protein